MDEVCLCRPFVGVCVCMFVFGVGVVVAAVCVRMVMLMGVDSSQSAKSGSVSSGPSLLSVVDDACTGGRPVDETDFGISCDSIFSYSAPPLRLNKRRNLRGEET